MNFPSTENFMFLQFGYWYVGEGGGGGGVTDGQQPAVGGGALGELVGLGGQSFLNNISGEELIECGY